MNDLIKKIRTNLPFILTAALVGLAVFVLSNQQPSDANKSTPDALSSQVISNCNATRLSRDRISEETCYSKEFAKIAEQYDHEFAFQTLFALQKKDPNAIGCHLISHGIGWGAYKHNPSGWQTLIQAINSSCNYGAIHGVIESYIATLPEGRLTKELLPTICGVNPRADCNHIMGHLVLVETRADIGDALDMCEVFKDNSTQLFHCQTGVYMEYQTALNLIDHGLAPKSWLNWPARVDELEKICRETTRAAVACWKEIIHAALVKFNNDPKTIFDFCAKAQVLEGAKECRRHAIGVMAAGKNFDLPSLKSMCSLPQKSDPDFEGDCYVQLAASALSTLPAEQENVRNFCLGLPQQFQKNCLAQVQYKRIELND